MKKRVADIVIDTVQKLGIEQCFAVVGGGAMYLDHALGENHRIKTLFNHHEQACAMAADGYARLNDKPALVCVTTGPGATNTITGVMGAWQDGLPMIIISGQVRTATSVEASGLPLRYRGIQECEIVPMIQSITKYAKKLTDPNTAAEEVVKAYHIATTGRKGPVWLDIPLDIQSALIENRKVNLKPVKSKATVTAEQVKNVILELSQAKRPVILAGSGIASSGNLKLFQKFAAYWKMPVIAGSYASDILGGETSYYYGLTGTIGTRSGNFILQNADLILSLGCSLSYKVTGFAQEQFAKHGKIIAVDIDSNEMKKPGIHVDSLIECDICDFIKTALTIKMIPDVSKDWKTYCKNAKNKFNWFENADKTNMNSLVSAYYFWKQYYELSPRKSISVLGNNTASSVKLQTGVKYTGQRIITNSNCGSMGEDLPIAIGAACATGREIICLTGDGCIMMNLQELETIRFNKLPIKIVIFSNDGYNAIRQTCKNFFNGLNVGCNKESGVGIPSFRDVAKTFGFDYYCCAKNKDVCHSIKQLFSHKGNCILEIKQMLDDPISPKVMSHANADGSFSTPSLQDMYPFLSKEEMDRWMLWKD